MVLVSKNILLSVLSLFPVSDVILPSLAMTCSLVYMNIHILIIIILVSANCFSVIERHIIYVIFYYLLKITEPFL